MDTEKYLFDYKFPSTGSGYITGFFDIMNPSTSSRLGEGNMDKNYVF